MKSSGKAIISVWMGWILAAGMAGPDALASDINARWPEVWMTFGSVRPNAQLAAGARPTREMLLPGEALKTVPDVLEVDGVILKGRRMTLAPGEVVDLDLFGSPQRGTTVYLLAEIRSEEATTLTMGAGADWFMQWWLNGEPVFDTLSGNRETPIAVDNHVFDLPLEQGRNVLAVAVIRGSGSFAFAAGDPAAAPEAQPAVSRFEAAMNAGRDKIRLSAPGGWSKSAIDFPAVRADYEDALRYAHTVDEQIDARLALARVRRKDYHDRDHPAIRALYREAEALAEQDLPPDGTPLRVRAIKRANAVMGLGQTYLDEGRAADAREQFHRVEEARFGEIGGRTPQDFICGATQSLHMNAAYHTAWSHLLERRYHDARSTLLQLLQMEVVGPHRGMGWRAENFLEALRQLPRLRHDHPRLFMNNDTWPLIRERALTTERASFEKMKEEIFGLAGSPENVFAGRYALPETWGMLAMESAFIYRMTGDPDVFHMTRRVLRASVDYFLERSVDRCRSYPRIATTAALDMMWNHLDPPERESLRDGLLEYVYTMLSEDKLTGPTAGDTHYYERNVYRFAGLFLLQTDLDPVDYMRAFEILARDSNVPRMRASLLDETSTGPFTDLRLDYMFAESTGEVWTVLHAWESAMRKPLPERIVHWFPPEYALRGTLGFSPGLRHFEYGGTWRSRSGMRTNLLFDHLSQIMHFFGESHPVDAAIARHLRERMAEKKLAAAGQFPVFRFLLNLDRAPPAAIPADLPIARHFERMGQILMSSGFDPGDTFALFAAGGNGETGTYPADLDATHFTIYKQGHLAVDSGSRILHHAGAPGLNYSGQTVAHNAVLIYMDGEAFPNGAVNSGGQYRHPSHARLMAFESDPAFAYMATDATPVYHEDKCAQMVRQFVFLPPNHFVVFDRVTSTDAEYPKTWLLHTANEPDISGRTFSAEQAEGKLFCRTLLPADARVDKIGGPGKEFWAGGRNWPIPDDSPYLRSIGTASTADVPETLGRWRVEVQPGAPREEDHFLHLIQVAERGADAMVESELLDDGHRVGLRFRYGDAAYLVMFNRAGEIGGRIAIRQAGQTRTDREFRPAAMR